MGPICRTPGASLDCGLLTSRAYWQAKARAGSRMRARHEVLARDVALIRAHRFMAVYGYRKMLMQLRRRGWDGIGRDQVLGVMRSLGIQGARRARIPRRGAVATARTWWSAVSRPTLRAGCTWPT